MFTSKIWLKRRSHDTGKTTISCTVSSFVLVQHRMDQNAHVIIVGISFYNKKQKTKNKTNKKQKKQKQIYKKNEKQVHITCLLNDSNNPMVVT